MINKKSCLKVFILLILSLLIMVNMPNYSQARGVTGGFTNPETSIYDGGGSSSTSETGGDAISDPNIFKPGGLTTEDTNAITKKANSIVGIIVTVGTVASVITVIILGIKYMLGSVEEKAEYKKSMLPYLIGAVLLFAGSTIVSIIAKLVQGTGLAQ